MPSERLIHFSNQFVISCGTVTLDVERSKVLLIRNRKNGEHLLPKGRKDVGETLEQAALRETYEETGYTVQLLPIIMPTLATSPAECSIRDSARKDEISRADDASRVQRVKCTEPIALQQRTTRQGKHKIIFWFVGKGDSSLSPAEGTQMANEDFENVWAPIETFQNLMSYDDDRQVVDRAIGLLQEQKMSKECDSRKDLMV